MNNEYLKNRLEAARHIATSKHEKTVFNCFTPVVLSSMIIFLKKFAIRPETIIAGPDIWTDITTDGEFASFADSFTRLDLIKPLPCVRIFGLELVIDEFDILDKGEVFVVGSTKYTDLDSDCLTVPASKPVTFLEHLDSMSRCHNDYAMCWGHKL